MRINPLSNSGNNFYTNNFTFVNQVSFRGFEKHSDNIETIEGITNSESNEYELVFTNPSALSNNILFVAVCQNVEFLKVGLDGTVNRTA